MSITPIIAVFDTIRSNPAILRQNLPDMVSKLQKQANEDSQGTGNKVTAQEASFASVLESNGIKFQPKDADNPTEPGYYYLYQLNGSQQSIDFRVFESDGKEMVRKIDLDLKHTSSDVFFLNDGWFSKDVIYIVTWNRRTSQPRKRVTSVVATFIGLGQDIPSTRENEMMTELINIKKKYNSEFKGVDSLCTYVRFANRYKCDRFTPEFTEKCYTTVNNYVKTQSEPSSSSSDSSTKAPSTD